MYLLGKRGGSPLISLPNERSHVVFDGSGLIDMCGQSWVQNGTVPQVAGTGALPGGAGPFSGSNYYESADVVDVFDLCATSDFVCAYLFTPNGNSQYVVATGAAGTGKGGVCIQSNNSYHSLQWVAGATLVSGSGLASIVAGIINVGFVGRSGLNWYLQANRGGCVVIEDTYVRNVSTTQKTRIGCSLAGSAVMTGTVYEIALAATAPSADLFDSIAAAVKTRLGISAW